MVFVNVLQMNSASIYVFNLRGRCREHLVSFPDERKAGNVFGAGSREPIAITIAVKNPAENETRKKFITTILAITSQEKKNSHI